MKNLAIIALMLMAFSSQAFFVEGELKEVRIGMLATSIPIKVIESGDDVYVIAFKQAYNLEECAQGTFSLAQATSNDEEGYISYWITNLKCHVD